jgi:hypothetical protein
MIRAVVALALIGAFGVARMPLERSLESAEVRDGLRSSPPFLELRARTGQLGFLAALSGFRSPLAAYLWIEAHAAWQRTEWGRMAGLFETVTALQPRSPFYWDMAAWHMAWNASAAALQDPSQPSETLRIRSQRQYFRLGRDFLYRGIKNNPESSMLYRSLGILLRDKLHDHCGAGEAFLKASQLPDAAPYLERFAGYELAQCPGREQVAYEILRRIYDQGESARKPALTATLRELEKKLDVPEAQRVNSTD